MVHCISLAAGERLRRLGEHYDMVWATGWEEKANDYLPNVLGLPELPFLTFEGAARFGSAHWKLGPLDEYCSGRAVAWIDDSFDESCYEWARERSEPTLLVPTESGDRPRGGSHRGADRLGAGAWPMTCLGTPRTLASLDGTLMDGFWPIFFLAVVLKIPVLGALWLVWWASREPARGGLRGGRGRRLSPLPAAADTGPSGPRPRPARRRRRATAARLPARRAARAWSGRLRCPLSLAANLAEIRVEIHLDRVTLRGDEALLLRAPVLGDLRPHLSL